MLFVAAGSPARCACCRCPLYDSKSAATVGEVNRNPPSTEPSQIRQGLGEASVAARRGTGRDAGGQGGQGGGAGGPAHSSPASNKGSRYDAEAQGAPAASAVCSTSALPSAAPESPCPASASTTARQSPLLSGDGEDRAGRASPCVHTGSSSAGALGEGGMRDAAGRVAREVDIRVEQLFNKALTMVCKRRKKVTTRPWPVESSCLRRSERQGAAVRVK